MNKLHTGCAAAQIPIIECLHPTRQRRLRRHSMMTFYARHSGVQAEFLFFSNSTTNFGVVRQMKPLLKRNPQNRQLLFDTGRPTQNFCAILRKNFCWSEFFGSTVLKKIRYNISGRAPKYFFMSQIPILQNDLGYCAPPPKCCHPRIFFRPSDPKFCPPKTEICSYYKMVRNV
jgi:hypothetical protein